MATGVAFNQRALFRAIPGLFGQRSLFSKTTPFDNLSIEAQEVIALAKAVGGAFWDQNNLASMFTDDAETSPMPATANMPVAVLRDLSGNGFHARQTTAAYRPYLRPADFSLDQVISGSSYHETWTPNAQTTLSSTPQGICWENGRAFFKGYGNRTGSYVSTVDSAQNSTPGDRCWIYEVYNTDFSSGMAQFVGSKGYTSSQESWRLQVNAAGIPTLVTCPTVSTDIAHTAGANLDAYNGQKIFLRVRIDVDNGAAGHDVWFHVSTDYNIETKTGTWTAVGPSDGKITTAGTTTIEDSTGDVYLGYYTSSAPSTFGGNIYYAAEFAGVDETTSAKNWEWHPTRDAVQPKGYWLEGDGFMTHFVTGLALGGTSPFTIVGAAMSRVALVRYLAGYFSSPSGGHAALGVTATTGFVAGAAGNLATGTIQTAESWVYKHQSVAITSTGTTAKMYVGGVLKDTDAITPSGSAGNIVLLGYSAAGTTGLPWNGCVHGLFAAPAVCTDAQLAMINRLFSGRMPS